MEMERQVLSPHRPRLNVLLEAVATGVRGALPDLKTCAAVHDGSFQAAELRRWSLQSPAVLIAWLGTPRTETPGVLWTDCDQQLAAFIVTRDAPAKRAKEKSLPRGKAARAIAAALLLLIPRARWGSTDIGGAERLQARNLFSAEIDKANVALWAVTWRQALRLEAAADGTCPPLPDELYTSAQDDRLVLARVHLAQDAPLGALSRRSSGRVRSRIRPNSTPRASGESG